MPTRRPRVKTHTAHVNDLVIRGTAKQIVEKCEGLGYAAERSKDQVTAQRFFQSAEHYKRIENNVNTTR